MPIEVSAGGGQSKDETRLYRLKRHTKAVRENPDLVHAILGFLLEEPPNASAAQEMLELAPRETQIDLWSCSTANGGIWETWMRDALKYGTTERTNSYNVWLARTGRPPAELKEI